ncbi:MAG: hypothetical protein WB676_21305 [Bryobacteraceae bacterium]
MAAIVAHIEVSPCRFETIPVRAITNGSGSGYIGLHHHYAVTGARAATLNFSSA